MTLRVPANPATDQRRSVMTERDNIKMIHSYVLVTNLRSKSEQLHFADFKFVRVGSNLDYDLKKAHSLFARAMPLYKDWFYERNYKGSDELMEKIPYDVEDTLFFLRLFKPGDLVFQNLCIETENGELLSQLPYRVMAHIHTTQMYQLETEECEAFDNFAKEMGSQRNLATSWFKTARRFFLYGGGKEFNPFHDEVDRVVDYMTALEALLVPEHDFVGRRLRERATSLLNDSNADPEDVKHLFKGFYNVRSAVVHGSNISDFKNGILKRNGDFERVVRRIIIQALKTLPENDKDRKAYLKNLFDVEDRDRSEQAFGDFCSVSTRQEKKNLFDRISNYLREAEEKEK